MSRGFSTSSQGFGAGERAAPGKDSFQSIKTTSKELYEYLEGEHSRVMEWSDKEVTKVAKFAAAIKDAFPSKGSRGEYDSEAVDFSVKMSRLLDPKINGDVESQIKFAKGFNALDKAIETQDMKKVGKVARDLLKNLENQNGVKYIDDVDSGVIEDPYVSELLSAFRGLSNASLRLSAPNDSVRQDANKALEALVERGKVSLSQDEDMFDQDSKRFTSPFEVIRKLDKNGIDVQKFGV